MPRQTTGTTAVTARCCTQTKTAPVLRRCPCALPASRRTLLSAPLSGPYTAQSRLLGSVKQQGMWRGSCECQLCAFLLQSVGAVVHVSVHAHNLEHPLRMLLTEFWVFRLAMVCMESHCSASCVLSSCACSVSFLSRAAACDSICCSCLAMVVACVCETTRCLCVCACKTFTRIAPQTSIKLLCKPSNQ